MIPGMIPKNAPVIEPLAIAFREGNHSSRFGKRFEIFAGRET
jgi:hypothetical protein